MVRGGEPSDALLDLGPQLGGVHPLRGQEVGDDTALFFQQGEEQVKGLDPLLSAFESRAEGRFQRPPGPFRKLVQAHGRK
jgi:hypothetical protein